MKVRYVAKGVNSYIHATVAASLFAPAICGMAPGARSQGWTVQRVKAPTCPHCRAKLGATVQARIGR